MTLPIAPPRPGISGWPLRRWLTAFPVATGYGVAVAIPTDLIDTPLFWREIPPTWWSWPALVTTSVLVGLLAATYVAPPDQPGPSDAPRRRGLVGGFLTFFAVGCPVCNKLVLLALGSSGAMAWFEPMQPLLQVAAIALLVWGLRARLRSEAACVVARPSASR